MRRIRYGVAASLDGYIAGPGGEYDWIPMDPEIDFAELVGRYDVWIMGRKTWEMMQGAPGGEAPGGGEAEIWVVSRTMKPEDHPGVTVVSGDLPERLAELKSRPGKDIWLYGGGELFRSLLELGEVDAVEVAIIPVLLGEGIPLLPSPAPRRRLELTGHRVYGKTGIVLLEYEVRPA